MTATLPLFPSWPTPATASSPGPVEAPAMVEPPKGLSADITVRLDGRPGLYRVRCCIGDVVSTVGLDGQGYQDASVGEVVRV